LAETKGFEPLVPDGTAVFKTAAFDHSATSPRGDLAETGEAVKVSYGFGPCPHRVDLLSVAGDLD
jgi:hypothetical protein